jgi:hypothetical protein
MLRLRQIALVAAKRAPVEREIRELLGLEVAYRDPMVATWGLENAVFPLGHQFLEVVAPTREGTAASRHLDRRGGDGGYMVILQTDEQDAARERARALGIRTAFESDMQEYRCWQLHPRDTGGAFLEIDRQEGAEDWSGPWHPAGPSWQSAIHTEIVHAIVAAEIQAAEPAAVAERWATILGRPVETTARGLEIRLDHGVLRFVAEDDGRGEGLGAIEVAAHDPTKLLRMAQRQGRLSAEEVVRVGGIRVRVAD